MASKKARAALGLIIHIILVSEDCKELNSGALETLQIFLFRGRIDNDSAQELHYFEWAVA
ncbi:hypothetical protein LAX21_25770 [Escherichia coli]|nr:hypothetical protein [Escherichia coli]MDD8655866.1 hypothetical protein [Escherichia coli]HDW2777528.1 hypothetical protein [Escherichia coli]